MWSRDNNLYTGTRTINRNKIGYSKVKVRSEIDSGMFKLNEETSEQFKMWMKYDHVN